MVSAREPDLMTDDDRRREVAALLARAVIRARRMVRLGLPTTCLPPADSSQNQLDHFADTRLTDANGTAG